MLWEVLSLSTSGSPSVMAATIPAMSRLIYILTIVYNKLDVAQTIDRQNRPTYRYYDAIRELIQTTDPMGRGTWYAWCICGGLSTLTDANGNVTHWGLDLQ